MPPEPKREKRALVEKERKPGMLGRDTRTFGQRVKDRFRNIVRRQPAESPAELRARLEARNREFKAEAKALRETVRNSISHEKVRQVLDSFEKEIEQENWASQRDVDKRYGWIKDLRTSYRGPDKVSESATADLIFLSLHTGEKIGKDDIGEIRRTSNIGRPQAPSWELADFFGSLAMLDKTGMKGNFANMKAVAENLYQYKPVEVENAILRLKRKGIQLTADSVKAEIRPDAEREERWQPEPRVKRAKLRPQLGR